MSTVTGQKPGFSKKPGFWCSTGPSPRCEETAMKRSICLAAGLVLAFAAAAVAESLVAEGAKVEKLADGFRFTEGPAVDAKGNVFFSDIPNNRIHLWSVEGKLSTFRENSGGANGLFLDRAGNVLACEGTARRLTSTAVEASADGKPIAGKVTVLADKYNGKKFNAPNDLWIDPDGGVYFTDPYYGPKMELEQGGFHVYYLSADRKQLTRVIDDLKMPNGVLGTSDGKLLYVADPGDRKTYRYAIQGPGKLGERKLFAEQGSDGMTLDNQGNLYLTGRGVTVYAPDGKKLETIDVPEGPANVCFGGKDRDRLFITARTSLYAVTMRVKGQ
jgi:gluconolactonase